ncbi:UPF0728 protein-like [Convolutriloba macropyga]|uniref:UPF0728 protein-like n=1 Tax=Convolutriloba macropyga TaxID=536237 RepID=UPI003F5246B0
MPLRTKVFVSYGPYRNCLGSLTYEPARLDGLRTLLEANEHQMIYHQTKNLNELAITVNGEMVYQGKVDQLDFSGDGELDPMCKEILEIVTNAY